MRRYPKAYNRFNLAVSLLSIAIVIGAGIVSRSRLDFKWYELIIFFVMIFISERLPIKLPGAFSQVTMTMPAVFGLFLSREPPTMILISSMAIFFAFVSDRSFRKQYPRNFLLTLAISNTGMYVLSLAVASIGYRLVGGTFLPAEVGNINLAQMVVPLISWVAITTTVNMLLVTTGLALLMREPWRMYAIQNLRWVIPNYVITGPFALLFAYLFIRAEAVTGFGILGVLLVIFPFLLSRQALTQYSNSIDAYKQTITTLGQYMQHYHPYTKGHLERVAYLSDKIAKQMNLPPRSLEFIKEAGQLHDIGKVGVSDEILDKTDKLSDEDWNTIKQHPARGAEILSQMQYLEVIVPWVRGHHERPDGRGYPDSLKDSEIPIEAAVIAVADAFDAMTGGPEEQDQRVYRRRLTLDQGMDQVRYGAGTQFDPRVVKAFMQVMAREGVENG